MLILDAVHRLFNMYSTYFGSTQTRVIRRWTADVMETNFLDIDNWTLLDGYQN